MVLVALDPRLWLIGLVWGSVLDSLNRLAAHHRRASFRIATSGATRTLITEGEIARCASGAMDWPTTAPWLNQPMDRIFLSYTHASTWGRETAERVMGSFSPTQRERVFLDRNAIGLGTSWCDRLNLELARATVVVAFIDQVSVGRPWPEAEIMAALESRIRTGLPSIAVVIGPVLAESLDQGALPASTGVGLRSVLTTSPTTSRAISVIDGREARIAERLADALQRNAFVSTAVLPVLVSDLVRLVSWPFLTFVMQLAPLGTPISLASALFAAGTGLLPTHVLFMFLAALGTGSAARAVLAPWMDLEQLLAPHKRQLVANLVCWSAVMIGLSVWHDALMLAPASGIVGAGFLMADAHLAWWRRGSTAGP